MFIQLICPLYYNIRIISDIYPNIYLDTWSNVLPLCEIFAMTESEIYNMLDVL